VELSPFDLGREDQDTSNRKPAKKEILHIMAGRRDKGPAHVDDIGPNLVGKLVQRGVSGKHLVRKSPLADRLRKAILDMHQSHISQPHGGLIFFPHDRKLSPTAGGPIEPPPEERQWLFHFSPSQQWRGHIEQFWVWRNYLDLEQGHREGKHLRPFVNLVEETLGSGRRITVREGKVYVTPIWAVGNAAPDEAMVRIHQLPSGEQQVLVLLGELVRRAKPGAVVIIDEPEISLHPTLQRVLVSRLKHFARTWDAQLLIATHSLEILRAVRESEVVNLDRLLAEGSQEVAAP
jgi:hypothetical protein